MKKQLLWGLGGMALVLSACSQDGGVAIGQGFNMGVNIAGGASATSVSLKTITTTQPTAVFTVKPQSVGLYLTSYHIEYKNRDGSAYGGSSGIFDTNVNTRVPGGFYCVVTNGGAIDTNVTIDTCPAADTKTPITRSYVMGNPINQDNTTLPLIGSQFPVMTSALSQIIAAQCLASGCPDVYFNIIFHGVDDVGRAQTVTANNVFYSATTVQ